MKELNDILESAYTSAKSEVKKDKGKEFVGRLNNKQRDNLTIIVDKCESFKAVLSVLITSLIKKIESPSQDVRIHQNKLKGGYSGRTIDTRYVTPFLKKNFTRVSMKESGWLTRSLEQATPYSLDYKGEINNKKVKKAFLEILHGIEANKENPEKYLISLFVLLINKTKSKKLKIKHIENLDSTTISLIMASLQEHFFKRYGVSGASKLPVIALYSIYSLLVRDLQRYKSKKLLPLKSHIGSDVRSKDIGDITVVNEKRKFFEGVEVKHGIQIDSIIVNDAFEKIKNTETSRYYLLTTSDPNIKSGEEDKINEIVETIRKTHGCEIIVNGLINSLNYYLRLLTKPSEFISIYTQNLQKDFEKTTEIKEEHLKAWKEIIKDNF